VDSQQIDFRFCDLSEKPQYNVGAWNWCGKLTGVIS
jgi:hypothetical protein